MLVSNHEENLKRIQSVGGKGMFNNSIIQNLKLFHMHLLQTTITPDVFVAVLSGNKSKVFVQ